jgi:hypothetical protein
MDDWGFGENEWKWAEDIVYIWSPKDLPIELKDYDLLRIVKETRILEAKKFDKWINIHYTGLLRWCKYPFSINALATFKDGKLLTVEVED